MADGNCTVLPEAAPDARRDSVSETLENAIAHAIGRAERVISTGPFELVDAEPEALAAALDAALAFVGTLENIKQGLELDEVGRRAEEHDRDIEDGGTGRAGRLAVELREALGEISKDAVLAKEPGNQLACLEDVLSDFLDDIRHEGVKYEAEEEPSDAERDTSIRKQTARVLEAFKEHRDAWKGVKTADDIPIAVRLYDELTRLEGCLAGIQREAADSPTARNIGPAEDCIRKAISLSQLCFAAATNTSAADVHEEIADAMSDIQDSLHEALKALGDSEPKS